MLELSDDQGLFLLEFNDYIYVRITALNQFGPGPTSDVNEPSVKVKSEPRYMNAIQRDPQTNDQ